MRVPRSWRLLVLVAAAAALVGYLGFELGRQQAGYSVEAAGAERLRLELRVMELGRSELAARRELAAEKVARQIDAEALREAQRLAGEQQAEVARQQQELQFYRGVLARQFGPGTLRVQELTVRGTDRERVIEAMLVQAGARDAVARGQLRLELEGRRAGAPLRVPLEQLGDVKRRSVAYQLRYFQALQIPVTLPEGFEPLAILVELRPAAGAPVEQRRFGWPGAAGTL